MFDELQQFREGYITECLELLADMEINLLGMSETSASREELDAIFRCAHSIKGGAGAFGLSAIAQFTHLLEATLDRLREGELTPSRTLIDTLLAARDIVLKMVCAARDNGKLSPDFGADVAARLNEYCELPAGIAHAPPLSAASPVPGPSRYSISFKPHRNLFLHGNDPILLLRELATLGECSITADLSALPTLDKLDAEQCYMSWQVTLVSEADEARIREVFEFALDECDLEVIRESAATAKAPVAVATPAIAPTAPTSAATPGGNVTSIRVDIDKVDTLINMVGEMVIIQAMLAMQTRDLHPQEHAGIMAGIAELTAHTRDLQEAVMAVRMQPVKSIFSRMPRLVRDLSSQLGKDIRLQTSGETTEVDKTIIEQLSDPLNHMIRNALDHGLETPQERLAAGKPAQGTVHLSAFHRGGRIIIELRDDGRGIDRARVLKKAQEKGLVARDATLSESEIDHLIFAPGFSTAEQVTSISGRGVGMDVVRRNIESIGGTVSLRNTPGEGTQFSISLPLTLAILDGMIVRVASEFYIIPIAHIIETLCPRAGEIREIADGQCVLNVRGEFVPVMRLSQLFQVPGADSAAARPLVVLVENGDEQMGLVVDELVGQQQVVIKSLEENSDPVAGISGATILGDGKVSLILDIAGLKQINIYTPNHRIAA